MEFSDSFSNCGRQRVIGKKDCHMVTWSELVLYLLEEFPGPLINKDRKIERNRNRKI